MNAEALKALLDEGGVAYRQNSRSYILSCPRCNKKDKLYLRKSDGRFVCWVCRDSEGFQGTAEWALTEVLGRSVSDLKAVLYGEERRPGPLFVDLQLRDFFDDYEDVPFGIEELPEVYPDPDFRDLDTAAGDRGRAYLESRGIPLEVARQYDIKYCPREARVVFPVRARGRLLGWQSRYIGATSYFDAEADAMVNIPKALTSAGLKKDRVLMFGDRVTARHAILCEGPVDAIKAHLCGGNVATMGKAVSDIQLQLLRNCGIERLYLALDPDAFIETKRITREMIADMEIYDLRPPVPYKDLGEMSMEAVRAAFEKAPRIDSNYLFLHLENHYRVHP